MVRKGRWQHDTERKGRKKEKDHIKEAAKAYKTFSGALDSTDNNVKFIIKTDSIELDED